MRHMARPSICTESAECLGSNGALLGVSTQAIWPASNDAIFVPVTLSRPAFVSRMFTVNGSAVSGNIDVCILAADGTRLRSKGSTAQAGTSVLQFFTFADPILLSPGQYYMGVSLDNTSGRLGRFNISLIREQQYGVMKMASAFPIPATVTFATVTATYIPSIGMELMGVL